MFRVSKKACELYDGFMNKILFIIFASLFSISVHANTEWFCKPNAFSNYRPMASHRCSQMGQGTAYCRTQGHSEVGRCGTFQVNGSHIQATFTSQDGRTHQANIAPVTLAPETLQEGGPDNGNRSEVTGGGQQSRPRRTGSALSNLYPPRTASFSESRRTADSYTNVEWLGMSDLQRANYIMEVSQALVSAHGLSYSPRVLTCKAFRESCFRPQDTTPGSASTAAGLSQVTVSTARDLFSRGGWFQSKVPGYTEVRDGRTYYNNMAGSMVAQLEIGMAVLHQKALDNNTTNIKTLLARYYGTSSSTQNNNYANAIYNCAQCIVDSGQVTLQCLGRARRACIVP